MATIKNLQDIPKPTTIIKEGLVTKQGGRIKTWKKRWCVLSDIGLLYYKTQQNATLRYNNLQGHIELGSIESVEPVTEKDKQKKKSCFKIVTPGRVFLMSAENDREMDSWIEEIRALINSETKEPELFLQIVRLAMPKRQEIDYYSKSLEELEGLLGSHEDSLRSEINTFVDICLKEKDALLDELTSREVAEVEQLYRAQRAEIAQELKLREN